MCWHSCRRATDMRMAVLWCILISSEWAAADDLVAAGKDVYSQTCIACHGADGKGAIPGVRNLTEADGALAKSDDELIENISNGLQTPGSFMAMPPKGGNPALTDEDIRAVLAYLRAEFAE